MKKSLHKTKEKSCLILYVLLGAGIIFFFFLGLHNILQRLAQPIVLFPIACTKAYTPLVDVPYRNTFDKLYYGKIFGTVQKIEKDANNKNLNVYLKTAHAMYLLPISMLNPHNRIYDLQTHNDYPLNFLAVNKQVTISFSCFFEKPDTIAISIVTN